MGLPSASPDRAPPRPQLSVGVVDEDAFVRSWVRLSFKGTEFRVAGEAGTMDEAVALVERRRPEVLLIDYHLPDGTGAALVRSLRLGGLTTRVLIMTAAPRAGLNEEVRDAGAQGIVLKRADPGDLLRALREVASGGSVVETSHPRRHPTGAALTPRERDVLRLAARGSTNPEIAAELGISRESVKTLLRRAFQKFGVRNRVEAIAVARDRGLL